MYPFGINGIRVGLLGLAQWPKYSQAVTKCQRISIQALSSQFKFTMCFLRCKHETLTNLAPLFLISS